MTTVKLDPEFAFLSMVTDPNTGESTITVESKENQIGVYDIKAIFSNEDPFSRMEPIEYAF